MKKVFRLGLITGVVLVMFCAGVVFAGDSLIIKGSTTVLPIAQKVSGLFQKLYPSVDISISGGGSGNGIRALIEGLTDVADSSRFIELSEVKRAVAKGVYPVPFRIAMDGIVPVVNARNGIKAITVKQLHDIYTGKIRNWKELGGPDHRIVVVSRDTSSGTYEVWEKRVLRGSRVLPRALVVASNGQVVNTVSKNRYAIGYIGIGYLNSRLCALTVNGIKATLDTVREGIYPISRPLFMFTNGWPKGIVAKWINLVLSRRGQNMVKESRYVPLF